MKTSASIAFITNWPKTWFEAETLYRLPIASVHAQSQ